MNTAQRKTALARAAGTAHLKYNAIGSFIDTHSTMIMEMLLLFVVFLDGFMTGRAI